MILKFGIFTDAHYAENKQYRNRYCDLSLRKLSTAVEVFNQRGVEFAVNLGDVVDGAHGVGAPSVDRSNYRAVSGVLKRFPGPVSHVLGNHDLESLTKSEVLNELRVYNPSTWYTFFRANCTFILMDANFRRDEIAYARGNFEWTDTAVSSEQLEWLQIAVKQAVPGPVFVFIHQNIDDRLGNGERDPHVVTNAQAVRHVLEAANRQIIVIQGHYHPGLSKKQDGVNYVGLRAMCEGGGPDDNAFAIVEIADDHAITVHGYGAQQSYTLR